MSSIKYLLLPLLLIAAVAGTLNAFDMPCRVYPADCPVVLRIYAEGIHDSNRLPRLEVSGVRVDGSSLAGKTLARGSWEKLDFVNKNGVIEIPVTLAGEYLHTIRLQVRTATGAVHQVGLFEIYSLKEDLFKCEPYLGDLHIHSRLSNGRQEPGAIAQLSIRRGYSFVCITDKDPEPLRKLAADPLWKECGFVLIPGEELSIDNRQLVISAVGASRRIKDFGRNAEIEAAKLYLPQVSRSSLDKRYHRNAALAMYINFLIRREGGVAVFCQPFLRSSGRFMTPPELRDFLLEKGGFNAFEAVNAMAGLDGWVLGYAVSSRLRGKGHPVPVATQNSRNVNQSNYGRHHTLIFAPENTQEALLDALKCGRSLAVSGLHGNLLLLGDERLVSYTNFLRDNYFEQHYKLAYSLGNALAQKLSGNPRAEKIFAGSAAEMKAFRRDFKYRDDSGKPQTPSGGGNIAQQQKK